MYALFLVLVRIHTTKFWSNHNCAVLSPLHVFAWETNWWALYILKLKHCHKQTGWSRLQQPQDIKNLNHKHLQEKQFFYYQWSDLALIWNMAELDAPAVLIESYSPSLHFSYVVEKETKPYSIPSDYDFLKHYPTFENHVFFFSSPPILGVL